MPSHPSYHWRHDVNSVAVETAPAKSPDIKRQIYAISRTHQRWFAPILVALISIGFFWPTVSTFFVGDDFYWIHSARYDFSTLPGFLHIFFHTNAMGTYRPLTENVYFWVCWTLFGSNPLGYHVVDLLVFVATAVGVYAIVLAFVRSPWIALGASSLWICSITHFEALAWAAAYAETGAVLCVVFGLLAAIRHRKLAMLLWYVTALMSNETAIVVPALVAVYYIVWERTGLVETAWRTASLWVAFLAYLVARVTFLGLHPSGPFAIILSPGTWLKLTAHSMLWMLGFTPTYLNVAEYSTSPWEQAAAVAKWLLLLGIAVTVLVAVLRILRQRVLDTRALQLVTIGILWFVIGLSPILPIANDYSDYNLAISLIGFPLILAGLATATGKVGSVLALCIGVAYLFVNGLAAYGPGGAAQVDGVAVYAREAYYAYVQMTAYEQRHPGPIHVQVNSSPAVQWTMQTNLEAELVSVGSEACYGAACPFTPDLRFHWNDATSHFTR